jgi:hypothetical protein
MWPGVLLCAERPALDPREDHMADIRSKSNKTLAVVTGEIVIQAKWHTASEAHAAAEAFTTAFERALGDVGTLRTIEVAEIRQAGEVIEARCRAEYGPNIGSYESDLRRGLDNVVAALLPTYKIIGSEVFHCSRREWKSREEIEMVIADLKKSVDDMSLSLATRKQRSSMLARLLAHLPVE